jgi:hypothetical protein
MEKKRITLFIFLLIILFAAFGATVDTSSNNPTFKARLAGSKELPPVQTKAHGEVTFQLNNKRDKLTYNVIIWNIRDITGASIHQGKPDQSGPPVADLFTEPKTVDISGNFLADGVIEAYMLVGPLKGKSLDSLVQLMKTGEAYINVYTKGHPEGEVRGQIE